ncbi:MAG TPA: arsenite methyltransferase [Bacteroidia bacterium]|nr:arsenite methyltransferase [Bacteroidia bacterium]
MKNQLIVKAKSAVSNTHVSADSKSCCDPTCCSDEKNENIHKNEEELKEIVREKYAEIALADPSENKSCCTPACCVDGNKNSMADSYDGLSGYEPIADLGLGCGLPTEYAGIKKGDTVVDLGAGAGNDCFVARAETGETGRVIGIDMTSEMIKRARKNVESLGYKNVEFRLGEIENIPVEADEADVVISNCVLNLVPNKNKAFREIHRILKPGGHFSVSDIVLTGPLPQSLIKVAELYAGCVSGAVSKDEYLNMISENGFKNIKIQKVKKIELPEEFLQSHLSDEEMELVRNTKIGIESISVYAEKPLNF